MFGIVFTFSILLYFLIFLLYYSAMRVILASASPRRRELLKKVVPEFSIEVADIDEDIGFSSPFELVSRLSLLKALAVAKFHEDNVVIGADTTVVLGGKVLNKPQTHDEAVEMLQKLSGKTHSVLTGVSFVRQNKSTTFVSESLVTFRKLGDGEILFYVNSGSPFDKAGGYGIQDSDFAVEVKGDIDNVIGLPAEMLKLKLQEFLAENFFGDEGWQF